jgi:hypothetical protein
LELAQRIASPPPAQRSQGLLEGVFVSRAQDGNGFAVARHNQFAFSLEVAPKFGRTAAKIPN